MKSILNVIMICLLSAHVYGQQSDHEIVEHYEKARMSLVSDVLTADSAIEYKNIINGIDSLKKMSQNHESILQYALYPRIPLEELDVLDAHSKRYYEFYFVLESSQSRLHELQSALNKARNEVEVLTNKSGLQLEQLADLKEHNNELRSQLRSYSELVNSRDELVLYMVDSLLLYSQPLLRISSMRPIQEGVDTPREITNDPLTVIENVLNGQLETLSEENPYLDADDLLRSYATYKELNDRWDRMRSAFVKSYGSSNEDLRIIDDKIRQLRVLSGDTFWKRVDSQLEERGFDAGIINDRSTFLSWLDARINDWQEETGSGFAWDDRAESVMTFHEYWQNHFDGEWRTSLINSELMSEGDLMRISSSVDQMIVESRPLPYWIILLSTFCVICVLAFLMVLFRAHTL